jgi:phospholipid/cholesterol/gamma-HCH transport system substrate-binding protein
VRGLRFSKPTLLKVLGFVALSMVFTFALAVKIGNIRLFSHTYRLHAVFADASGVFKGDAVKLAGVDVGRVETAQIQRGKAVVTFNVNDSVKLPTDTVVAIRWRNLLGQRFLYLYPGTDTHFYADDQTVPLSRTEDAGDIGQFLNDLGPILKAIDPEKANAFLDAMNQALSGNEATVRQLIGDGAVLSTRLSSMDDQIKTLISSSDTVISTYASQDHEIATILDDLDQVGGRLDQMTGDINSLVTNFADVQQQLDRLLKENRSNIDTDLTDLAAVVTTIADSGRNLEATLCSLPAGVAGYFQTTSWGEWFNVRIVAVTLKDRQSATVAQVNETPNERGPTGTVPPVYTCGGTPAAPGTKGKHAKGAKGGAPVATTSAAYRAPVSPAPPRGGPAFQNIGAFVRFVLQGGPGG